MDRIHKPNSPTTTGNNSVIPKNPQANSSSSDPAIRDTNAVTTTQIQFLPRINPSTESPTSSSSRQDWFSEAQLSLSPPFIDKLDYTLRRIAKLSAQIGSNITESEEYSQISNEFKTIAPTLGFVGQNSDLILRKLLINLEKNSVSTPIKQILDKIQDCNQEIIGLRNIWAATSNILSPNNLAQALSIDVADHDTQNLQAFVLDPNFLEDKEKEIRDTKMRLVDEFELLTKEKIAKIRKEIESTEQQRENVSTIPHLDNDTALGYQQDFSEKIQALQGEINRLSMELEILKLEQKIPAHGGDLSQNLVEEFAQLSNEKQHYINHIETEIEKINSKIQNQKISDDIDLDSLSFILNLEEKINDLNKNRTFFMKELELLEKQFGRLNLQTTASSS